MKRSGTADLPLHNGSVPYWLAERMARISESITEIILMDYGKKHFLSRMSDPFWFQSLGAVMGMDWHSSGITTSVMGALKKAIHPHAREWGLAVCGGRGKHSRKTPVELKKYAEQTGIHAESLSRQSRLIARIDNNAVQDGFQIYLHSFIVSDEGDWTVIQQGMSPELGQARRYHWHSADVHSFISEPHTAVCGVSKGQILNLVDKTAGHTQNAMINITSEKPVNILKEARHLHMPGHHDVRVKDVNLKRLGTVLALAREQEVKDFESLLLLEGAGPRTIQSLALVSEVIHGTPSRFADPARFSFAHGGKDGHPFPVPVTVYDETISVLEKAVNQAKLGAVEKKNALKSLHKIALRAEKSFSPDPDRFDHYIQHERDISHSYGGRTVFDKVHQSQQLKLF